MRASDTVSRSSPSSRISPEILALERRCRPRTDKLVTDLPEPDSPTMPMVEPRSSSKLMPSTDLTSPSSVGKWTCRSLTSRNGCGRGAVGPEVPFPGVRGAGGGGVWSRNSLSRGYGVRGAGRSGQTGPRVDHAVQQVDDQVGHDDEEGG